MQKEKSEFIDRISKNKDIIQKICNVYCNRECDQEDLSQEIVYQLWKSYGNFRYESVFSTWMYKVALNTAFQYIRYKKRRPQVEDMNHNQLDIQDEPGIQSTDLTKILYNLINQLRPFDKALLMLWLEKKSYAEISGIVGISEKNVSVKIVRIKEKLKKLAAIVEFEI